MFVKNQEVSRRRFLQLASLSTLGVGTVWASVLPAARLDIGKTSTNVRIIATINPTDSGWTLLQSTDHGKTWTAVTSAPVVIGQSRLKWDLPDRDKTVIFRLLLVTDAAIQLPNNLFFQVQSGQTLFAAMEKLRLSNSSFKFTSEYKADPGGQFVTEINGTKGKWVFEVNGEEMLNAGSSHYTLKPDDEIKWFLV